MGTKRVSTIWQSRYSQLGGYLRYKALLYKWVIYYDRLASPIYRYITITTMRQGFPTPGDLWLNTQLSPALETLQGQIYNA